LLLVVVLCILSGYRRSRNLKSFACKHREVFNESLGLDYKRWPSDGTFLYLYSFSEVIYYNKAHPQ